MEANIQSQKKQYSEFAAVLGHAAPDRTLKNNLKSLQNTFRHVRKDKSLSKAFSDLYGLFLKKPEKLGPVLLNLSEQACKEHSVPLLGLICHGNPVGWFLRLEENALSTIGIKEFLEAFDIKQEATAAALFDGYLSRFGQTRLELGHYEDINLTKITYRNKRITLRSFEENIWSAIAEFQNTWKQGFDLRFEGTLKQFITILQKNLVFHSPTRKFKEVTYWEWLSEARERLVETLAQHSRVLIDEKRLISFPCTYALEGLLAGIGLCLDQLVFRDPLDAARTGRKNERIVLPCLVCGQWTLTRIDAPRCDNYGCIKKTNCLHDPLKQQYYNLAPEKKKTMSYSQYRKNRKDRGRLNLTTRYRFEFTKGKPSITNLD